MSAAIVEVNSISKCFSLKPTHQSNEGVSGLISCLLGRGRNISIEREILPEDQFWALKNISFEVKQGECLGIVGMNGAGKSTLLKILLGRLSQDGGTIDITGQAGGLIELGAGFHDELTGIENIYINAALLGKSKKEVSDQIGGIIQFADIGNFINSPVKSYSSGMRVRLGFSVAIHFIPDLVICDEILAVGDFEFRQKCYLKLSELKNEKSFILVSHSAADVMNFCDRAILLHNGELIVEGSPEFVLDCYTHCEHKLSASELRKRLGGLKKIQINIPREALKKKPMKKEIVIQKRDDVMLSNDDKLTLLGKEYLNAEYIKNIRVSWNLEKSREEYLYVHPRPIVIDVVFELKKSCANFQIGVPFRNETGEMIFGPSNKKDRTGLKPGVHKVRIEISDFPIYHGRLWPLIALSDMPGFMVRKYLPYIDIYSEYDAYGKFHCEYSISYDSNEQAHPFEESKSTIVVDF